MALEKGEFQGIIARLRRDERFSQVPLLQVLEDLLDGLEERRMYEGELTLEREERLKVTEGLLDPKSYAFALGVLRREGEIKEALGTDFEDFHYTFSHLIERSTTFSTQEAYANMALALPAIIKRGVNTMALAYHLISGVNTGKTAMGNYLMEHLNGVVVEYVRTVCTTGDWKKAKNILSMVGDAVLPFVVCYGMEAADSFRKNQERYTSHLDDALDCLLNKYGRDLDTRSLMECPPLTSWLAAGWPDERPWMEGPGHFAVMIDSPPSYLVAPDTMARFLIACTSESFSWFAVVVVTANPDAGNMDWYRRVLSSTYARDYMKGIFIYTYGEEFPELFGRYRNYELKKHVMKEFRIAKMMERFIPYMEADINASEATDEKTREKHLAEKEKHLNNIKELFGKTWVDGKHVVDEDMMSRIDFIVRELEKTKEIQGIDEYKDTVEKLKEFLDEYNRPYSTYYYDMISTKKQLESQGDKFEISEFKPVGDMLSYYFPNADDMYEELSILAHSHISGLSRYSEYSVTRSSSIIADKLAKEVKEKGAENVDWEARLAKVNKWLADMEKMDNMDAETEDKIIKETREEIAKELGRTYDHTRKVRDNLKKIIDHINENETDIEEKYGHLIPKTRDMAAVLEEFVEALSTRSLTDLEKHDFLRKLNHLEICRIEDGKILINRDKWSNSWYGWVSLYQVLHDLAFIETLLNGGVIPKKARDIMTAKYVFTVFGIGSPVTEAIFNVLDVWKSPS